MSALALLLAVAHAADPAVLLLGNSYVQTGQLDQMLEDTLPGIVPGSDGFVAERRAAGGLRLVDHLARVEGREQGENNAWRTALVTGQETWGVVVLQEQSQIPGFPDTEPYFVESVESAVELDGYIEAHGADTAFLATWGRRGGDEQNPDLYPDFETMNARLLDGYRAYVAATSTPERRTFLLPVGSAFAAVKSADEAVFAELYSGDGSHPTATGTYLAALTATAALSGWPVTGSAAPGDAFDAATVSTLQAAADAVTVGDPWSESFRFADTFTGGDALVVHDPWMRRQVRVEEDVGALTSVVVGDGSRSDDAELHVLAGGALTTDRLDLGDGRLQVRGGIVGAATLAGTGPIDVDGGTLRLAGGSAGALTTRGGATLVLAGGSPEVDLVFEGSADLGGPIEVVSIDGTDGQDVLLVAESVTVEGDTTAPEGWALSVVDTDGGRQALVATPEGEAPATPVNTGGKPDDDCGCAAVGAASLAPALLALIAVARRRTGD
jgi:hypothetical protein